MCFVRSPGSLDYRPLSLSILFSSRLSSLTQSQIKNPSTPLDHLASFPPSLSPAPPALFIPFPHLCPHQNIMNTKATLHVPPLPLLPFLTPPLSSSILRPLLATRALFPCVVFGLVSSQLMEWACFAHSAAKAYRVMGGGSRQLIGQWKAGPAVVAAVVIGQGERQKGGGVAWKPKPCPPAPAWPALHKYLRLHLNCGLKLLKSSDTDMLAWPTSHLLPLCSSDLAHSPGESKLLWLKLQHTATVSQTWSTLWLEITHYERTTRVHTYSRRQGGPVIRCLLVQTCEHI